MKRPALVLLSATCLMTACAATPEPGPLISARGVVPRTGSGYTGDLFARFQRAASELSEESGEADTGPFLQSGFALAYADCDAFFRGTGRDQRSARVVRDTIAPLVALLTGIVALRDFGEGREERLLTTLSLWSSVSTAGFDLYDRHFLFGAENVDAVRELILNALTVHSAAVFAEPPTSFEDAAVQIMDNATICTPPHILRLVREAIRNGELEPTITGSAAFQQEFEVRRALGQLLHPPNPASDQETFILWQLLIDPRSENQERLASMYSALASLGANNPIQEDTDAAGEKTYTYRANWSLEPAVVERLLRLPVETLARYEAAMQREAPQFETQFVGQTEARTPPSRRTARRVGVSVRD